MATAVPGCFTPAAPGESPGCTKPGAKWDSRRYRLPITCVQHLLTSHLSPSAVTGVLAVLGATNPTPFVRISSPVRDNRFGSWSGAHGDNNKADRRREDRE